MYCLIISPSSVFVCDLKCSSAARKFVKAYTIFKKIWPNVWKQNVLKLDKDNPIKQMMQKIVFINIC